MKLERTKEWNCSYRENEEMIIEKYEKDAALDFTKSYFEKLFKIVNDREDNLVNDIINGELNIKKNKSNNNINYVQYYVDLPFNNLNIVMNNISNDAKIQLEFIFLKRYLNQCKEFEEDKKLFGIEVFNIYSKERIMNIARDIINYLNENVDSVSECNGNLTITTSFDNIADMFYDLWNLIPEIGMNTVDDCPPYDLTISDLWNDLIEEKYEEDEE